MCPKQKYTEESVEASVVRSVEALFAEVSFEVKPRVDGKPAYAESMSNTRGLAHNDLDLEDIVVNLRKQSKNDDQAPCLMNLIMNPMILTSASC